MSFQDIKGQEKTVQIIKEDLLHCHLPGGYLFIGPEGVGKRLTAKALAKTVNCHQKQLDCCDNCNSCLKIENNLHPDVHIFDSEGNVNSGGHIKIECIRQLQKDINLKAYEARKKVFIINNAHNLTAEAANSLLKILEEPPLDSLIILISAKPTLLFKTVTSRCRILKFYSLSRLHLEDLLRKDYGLNALLAHFLAYFCEGRLGEALRLKDADFLKIKNKTIDALALGKSSLGTLNIRNKESASSYLNILAAWFRDIYLIKTGIPYRELINLDRKAELLNSINKFSFLDLHEIMDSISGALTYLEQNINLKLVFSNLKEQLWKRQF